MIDLTIAHRIVLAELGYHDSHTLNRTTTGWEYGERTCHDDTCHCTTHNPWHYQDCSEDEAAEIIAAFAAKGFQPKQTDPPPHRLYDRD